jgi:serine/threonine protein kinase/Flp pilus assembly protein TadD
MELIGEGGMGLVFVAEQQQPLRRNVALKVIKPGMDSREVVARFEAERQALAIMDHPNIASVFDGGSTSSGRPYFVMELVKGLPITDYCDRHNLTPRDRLELFLSVCKAVQHAHQKGIIHRDLKPSNVLVTLHDAAPVVKVIDFGISKALGQQLTDKTVYTAFAQIVGTPMYMSPEQAGLSGQDVDTRSDIYALGVLLYELLTGTTPFDKERLGRGGYEEMLRIIREEEAIRPSSRISSLGQAAAPLSARRQLEPNELCQMLRRELDWIVMKALEKDRNRRYETANLLAADVQRYLNDEPVLACPPSALYRLRKLTRRHRWSLALAGVGTAALVVISAGSLIAALVLNRALQESAAANERERAAKESAERQRDRADRQFKLAREAVDHFHTEVSQSAEMKARGVEGLRTKLLEGAAGFYERFTRDEEEDGGVEIEAERGRSLMRLASLLQDVGKNAEAERRYRQAEASARRLADTDAANPEHRKDLAACLDRLGNLYTSLGQKKEAESTLQDACTLRRVMADARPEKADCLKDLAESLNLLGNLYNRSNRHADAEKAYLASLDLEQRVAAAHPDNPEFQLAIAWKLHNLGLLYQVDFRLRDAETNVREARSLARRLTDAHPGVSEYQDILASSSWLLSYVYFLLGRRSDAETVGTEAVNTFRVLAESHPTVSLFQRRLAGSLAALARFTSDGGRPGEGLILYDEAVRRLQTLLASEPRLADAWLFLGRAQSGRAETLTRLGRPSEAATEWGHTAETCLRAAELFDSGLDPELRCLRVEALTRSGPSDSRL